MWWLSLLWCLSWQYFQSAPVVRENSVVTYKRKSVVVGGSGILKGKTQKSGATWLKLDKCEELFCVRWSLDSRISTKWEYRSESAIWLQCGLLGDHRLSSRGAFSSITDELLFLLTCHCPFLKNKRMKWRTVGRERWRRDPWVAIIGSMFLNYTCRDKVSDLAKPRLFWYGEGWSHGLGNDLTRKC